MTKTEFIFAIHAASNINVGKKELALLFLTSGGGKLTSIAKVLNENPNTTRNRASAMTVKGLIWNANKGSLTSQPLYMPSAKGAEVMGRIMAAANFKNHETNIPKRSDLSAAGANLFEL